MKKEKSVRKAEWKKKIVKQLKSLILPVLILLILVAGVLIIVFTKTPVEQEEIVKVNAYAGDETELVLENDELKMVMDPETTQFSLTVKDSGQVWYSNPEGIEDDPIALTVEKARLNSTILLTYSTINGVDTLYNNYTYSIENKIYDIIADENSIKVCYSIGDLDKEYAIPVVISEERMNQFLSQMSASESSSVKDYYKKYDPENLGKKDNLEELQETYPLIAEGTIYVLRDTVKDNLKVKFQEYFANAGYTYEDFLADKENASGESSSDKPVFNISVVYSLDGSDLMVDVPMEELQYKSDYPILNLSVLPYFGAGSTEEDGYLFVPEGGGALINFNNGKVSQSSYYANLYGWDMAQGRTALVHDTRTAFGVYGIAKSENSFICMLEDGSAYASVQADVSGKSNSFNYVNAIYYITHREQYDVSDKYNGKMFVYENQVADENLVQRFHFMNTDNYVDMANDYHDYLAEQTEGGLSMNEEASVPVAVELLCAVDKVTQVFGIPVSKPLALTTYAEAETIVNTLLAEGMTNMDVKLTGWMNGGINQKLLDNVQLISLLGNKKSLKHLISEAQAAGIPVYLDGITNYAKDSDLFDGFIVFRDAARLVSKEKAELKDYSTIWYGQNDFDDTYYLLKPFLIMKMTDTLAKACTNYGTDAMSFRDIGYELSADYSRETPVSREAALNMQVAKLQELKSAGQYIMINGGNDYAAPYADVITNLDLGGTDYAIIDESVPFYQIALHGYVNYTGEPLNLTSDYQEELLLSAESGAGLHFVFMNAQPTVLQKTLYTQYYGANFDNWHERALEIYNRYKEELGDTFSFRITGHDQIANGVRVTTYENGTKVYVNFTYSDYDADGITVSARDYTVVK